MVAGVKVRGPFTGPSGYAHHVREFVRALAAKEVPVQLENFADWSPVHLPRELREPWFESLTAPVDATAVLHFCFPNQVQPEPGRANVNFTMFEATRIPATWVVAHDRSDLIVVPTEHSRRAWIDSGVPESKLRLCPLGVRADLFRPDVRPLPLTGTTGRTVQSYAVRFLNVSELGARKNLTGLLRAWLRATTTEDDAVLIMKLGAYNAGSLAEWQFTVQNVERQAGKRLDQAAPVHFIYDLLPDADMPRLFAIATHYVSLSYGEGWDLSMIEAAATGLRLIAPRHSAYLAYLDDDVATLIPTRETPALNAAGAWVSPLFTDASWWVPDENKAVEHLRKAIDGNDTPRASARDSVSERFGWDRATDSLIEILEEAEAIACR